MKKTRKTLAAAMAVLMLTGTFVSCRKNGGAAGSDSDEGGGGPRIAGSEQATSRAEVLTGVYAPTELALPEGYHAGYETQNCSPFVDRETGGITVLLTRNSEREDLPPYVLATLDAEHGVTETVALPDLGGAGISRWAFDAEGRCFFTAQTAREQSPDGMFSYPDITLYRFDPPADGESDWSLSDGVLLNPLYGASGQFYTQNFIVDAEGDLWLECSIGMSSGKRIIFTPDLIRKTEKDVVENSPMTAIPESAGGGAAVKLNSLTIGAKFIAKDGTAKTVELPEMPDRVTFPEDGDGRVFYYSSNTGVWRADLNDKNEATLKCLMDFNNSNVKTNVNGGGSEWSYLLAVLNEDTMLFTERHGLTLYTASGDIDLSTLRTLEIAKSAESRMSDWDDLIVEYNKMHPDCRVVMKDYTLYNNAENPDGGVKRLAMDLVTGIYKPDIVIGQYGGDLLSVMVRDGIYTDLSPYIEKDDTVNRDNLFDCVERMFEAKDGGMWGLTDSLQLWGPFTTADTLAAYGPGLSEESGWSLEEMLDFVGRLPADVEFYGSLYRDSMSMTLTGSDAYAVFVDRERGEAHFDSPLFLRWLDFWKSLPSDRADWMKKTPTGQRYAARDEPAVYDAAYQGKIALRWTTLSSISGLDRIESLFGTKDWVMIGYPNGGRGAGHSGIECKADAALVMTSYCADPDLAWDVMRSLIAERSFGIDLPALESMFDRYVDLHDTLNHQTIVYFGGSSVGSGRDPDLTIADLKQPGYIVWPEQRDVDHIKRLLNSAGYPMTEKLPQEIAAIVEEEMSAYAGGVGTAEDCAKKIQSRVSIWLAENG